MADLVITKDLIKAAMPNVTLKNLEKYSSALISVMGHFSINTRRRVAAFLSQTGHECKDFSTMSENLNYSEKLLLKTFKKYFTAAQAKDYARQPERIANRVYANRMGNGDESSGDGWKYRGRGAIGITGKGMYQELQNKTGIKFVENPDLLLDAYNAVYAAGWFWNKNKLNSLADSISDESYIAMTKVINGGTNGLDDRLSRWEISRKALKVQ